MVKYLTILEKRFELNKQLKKLLIFFYKILDKYIVMQYNVLEIKIQEEQIMEKKYQAVNWNEPDNNYITSFWEQNLKQFWVTRQSTLVIQ